MNPVIGICAPAHRPQNWMALYNSIGQNDIDFELVFVGPNHPGYQLPKNFRFLKSSVKPAQCLEAAFRNTCADYIMPIADDLEFKTIRPLDKLYDLYKSCNCDKVVVSSRMMTNGKDQSSFAHRFFTDKDSEFVMPLSGLISKKFYRSLGGIDRNFIAVMWDLDIAMRAYAQGGKVVMSDVYLNEDRSKTMGSNLCNEFWSHDRKLLEKLWTVNGKLNLKRSRIVEPFLDRDILKFSQGPRGRWRGRGLAVLEKIEDKLLGRSTLFKRAIRGIKKPTRYFEYAKRTISHLR
jgi:hypothetical protein